jgi:diguanylate cyclase (GGDEF)-like protein
VTVNVADDGRAPPETADPGAALARRGAQALIFGAGLVTVANTLLSPFHGVDVRALRLTGLVTMLMSFGVALLPWRTHARAVSYGVLIAAMAALVGTDYVHHYSRDNAALAVYPIFFVIVIGYAGLTQPRGTATVVAALSAVALALLLHAGGHGPAVWQCVVVTVPAAAMLGETISWTQGRALELARLDSQRRAALETLVWGATRLQDALTPDEYRAIVVDTAEAMFNGTETEVDASPFTADDVDDVSFDANRALLHITLRGPSGAQGLLTTRVPEPDTFMFDVARLFSRQIGTRLEQLQVIHALTDAATHDQLTGLGNRRAADQELDVLNPGDAVFLLDLDHFKKINDTLGHQAGDGVLAELGEYLRGATRPSDLVARYGGEEFLLVCHNVTADVAERIANRFLDGWRARRPLVTFSVGFAIHTAETDSPLTIEHADMALYEAKRQGRDRACAYSPLIHGNAQSSVQVEG